MDGLGNGVHVSHLFWRKDVRAGVTVSFLGFQCISIEGQRARPENINHCSMSINQTVF